MPLPVHPKRPPHKTPTDMRQTVRGIRFPDQHSTEPWYSKIRSPKSRRKSCAPCALAKCKCDLQQPCSCCVSKKKECIFTDTKSVIAVKVTPVGARGVECTTTPSASADAIFTPDALFPSDLKSYTPEGHPDGRHPLHISSNLCLTTSSDSSLAGQDWLDDTGQFANQFNSSCLQDIFFDWNVPPGCGPLDFASTFSPVYASAETTPLGIIADPAHILTPSTYLELPNAQQSAGELKRYCMSFVFRTSAIRLKYYSRYRCEDIFHLPPGFAQHLAERRKIASPPNVYAGCWGISRKIARSSRSSTFCHRGHDASLGQ